MIIYKIINKINNKLYIGKTTQNPEKYIKEHFKAAFRQSTKNKYLYRAIRKYGVENFEWSILCECYTIEDLNKIEKYFIILLICLFTN